MISNNCCFMIDTASAFFRFFRIEGWFHSDTDKLVGINVVSNHISAQIVRINQPHLGVEAGLGPNKGFCIELMFGQDCQNQDHSIIFKTANGHTITITVSELCREREAGFEGVKLFEKFLENVKKLNRAEVLDVGGRARSGIDRSKMFDTANCVVLDIVDDHNVDVVGDAHQLSKLFQPQSFDAILSISVFEHLLMPWVVAIEMCRVLKLGGTAFVATHQTIGMHDMPWDFWRFSDTSWAALFNQKTGFEIIATALESPQYIVPHFHNIERGIGLERAVGYLGSSVLVRKISEPNIDWEAMQVSDVVNTHYPTGK